MSKPSYRVVLHGAPQFCEKLRAMLSGQHWSVQYYPERRPADIAGVANALRRCDLVYVRGGQIREGKFLRLARWMGAKKMIMVWIGTDALAARMRLAAEKLNGHVDPWIAKQTHWAVSPWVAEEVRTLGLDCEHVTESVIPQPSRLVPLPKEFSVLVFLPNVKADTLWLYGWDQVLQVARQLLAIPFTLVGLLPGSVLEIPPNIRNIGRMKDLSPVLQQSTVLLRIPRHDGLSWMVQEALAHGRHVIYTYPFAGCFQARNAESARAELDRLFALHHSGSLELNHVGARFMAQEYNPETVRADILKRWERIITGGGPAAGA